MKPVKIELNHKGIEQLMNSAEMASYLESNASRISNEAGEGYGYNIKQVVLDNRYGDKRLSAFVNAETPEAKEDNMNNNTLLKALHR